MKLIPKLVVVFAAVASCATASAQLSAREDAERRARNRDEAMANWQRTTAPEASRTSRDARLPAETRARLNDGDPTTRDASQDIRTVKSKTRQAAKATRSFTHRQAEKVRNFGERQQSKFKGPTSTRSANKSDTALGK